MVLLEAAIEAIFLNAPKLPIYKRSASHRFTIPKQILHFKHSDENLQKQYWGQSYKDFYIRGQSYKTFYTLGQIYKCVLKHIIVFVWSQLDGGKVEQKNITPVIVPCNLVLC